MPKQNWVIDTPDNFKIYGLLNTANGQKNTKAVIHIHGLTGDAYGYAASRMASVFPKYGYDVIRVNLYGWQRHSRSLLDCTLKQHAADINLIFEHFQKRYKKLFATGHSYGGPSLMKAQINKFDAVSLWDPTYLPQKSISKIDFIRLGRYYISAKHSPFAVSKKFIEEAIRFDREHSIALAKKCKAPIQVIYGGKNPFWLPEGESFHTHAKGPKDEKVIDLTQHCFHEAGSTAPLLRYTKEWFDRF